MDRFGLRSCLSPHLLPPLLLVPAEFYYKYLSYLTVNWKISLLVILLTYKSIRGRHLKSLLNSQVKLQVTHSTSGIFFLSLVLLTHRTVLTSFFFRCMCLSPPYLPSLFLIFSPHLSILLFSFSPSFQISASLILNTLTSTILSTPSSLLFLQHSNSQLLWKG